MRCSIVKGLGHYVPERVVSNDDLAQWMSTSDEWIRERTGIQQRRYFEPGEHTVSSMAAEASRQALEMADLNAQDLDMIVFATVTPDYYFPGSGVVLQDELGVPGIPALDIRQACSGFIYGISIADQYLKTGAAKHILVVGSEIQSGALDFSDEGRNVAVIFGDGAGAMVLSSEETEAKKGVLQTVLHSDGRFREALCMKEPSTSSGYEWQKGFSNKEEKHRVYPYMNGREVFKHAVVKFPEVIKEALGKAGLSLNEVDLVVPHQANARITQFIQQQLGLKEEQVVSNIHKYGNTTAASIPIALSEAYQGGSVHSGDLLCLAAFGSGFSWGASLIRWS